MSVNLYSAQIIIRSPSSLHADPVAGLDLIRKLAGSLDLHILETSEHVFPGGGYTSLLLLSESHIALHTWPEFDTTCIDLLSCKDSTGALPKHLKAFLDDAGHRTAGITVRQLAAAETGWSRLV